MLTRKIKKLKTKLDELREHKKEVIKEKDLLMLTDLNNSIKEIKNKIKTLKTSY